MLKNSLTRNAVYYACLVVYLFPIVSLNSPIPLSINNHFGESNLNVGFQNPWLNFNQDLNNANKIVFLRKESDQTSGQIYSINPDGSNLNQLTNIASGVNYFLASPDASKLLIYTGDSEVVVYDLLSEKTTKLSLNISHGYFAAWSPDGNQIAFLVSNFFAYMDNNPPMGGIIIYNLISNDSIVLAEDNQIWGTDFGWSADGKYLVWEEFMFDPPAVSSNDYWPSNKIYILSVDDNSIIEKIAANPFEECTHPLWMNSKTRFSCTNLYGSGVLDIKIFDHVGNIVNNFEKSITETQVSASTVNKWLLDWTPDDKKVLIETDNGFSYFDTEQGKSIDVNLDGGNNPRWSDDGNYIVYEKTNISSRNIYLLNLQGMTSVQLTEGTHIDVNPQWITGLSNQINFQELEMILDEKERIIKNIKTAPYSLFYDMVEDHSTIQAFDESGASELVKYFREGTASIDQIERMERHVIQEGAIEKIFLNYIELAGKNAEFNSNKENMIVGSLLLLAQALKNIEAATIGLIQELIVNSLQVYAGFQFDDDKRADLINKSDLFLDSINLISDPSYEGTFYNHTDQMLGEISKWSHYELYISDFVDRVQPTIVRGVNSVVETGKDGYVLAGDINAANIQISGLVNISYYEYEKAEYFYQRYSRGEEAAELTENIADLVSIGIGGPLMVISLVERIQHWLVNTIAINSIDTSMNCLVTLAKSSGELAFDPHQPTPECDKSKFGGINNVIANEGNQWDLSKAKTQILDAPSISRINIPVDLSNTIDGNRNHLFFTQAAADYIVAIDIFRNAMYSNNFSDISNSYNNLLIAEEKFIDGKRIALGVIYPELGEIWSPESEDFAIGIYKSYMNAILLHLSINWYLQDVESAEAKSYVDRILEASIENLKDVDKSWPDNIAVEGNLKSIPVLFDTPIYIQSYFPDEIELSTSVMNVGNSQLNNGTLSASVDGNEISNFNIEIMESGDWEKFDFRFIPSEVGVYEINLEVKDGDKNDEKTIYVEVNYGVENEEEKIADETRKLSIIDELLLTNSAILILIFGLCISSMILVIGFVALIIANKTENTKNLNDS